MQLNSLFKEFENLSMEKKTLIERPGLESQRSRKRLFFHRNILQLFKYIIQNSLKTSVGLNLTCSFFNLWHQITFI